MANKGGYLRPVVDPSISSSWQGHKNRRPPSQEPGTDFACAYGSQLFAPEDGVVVDLKHSTSGAMGRFLALDLDDGRRVRFLHLKSVLVANGRRVKRGDLIGYTGASAKGKEWGVGPHVHVTLWDFHRYVFSPNGTMDFVPQVGADNDGGNPVFNQTVANEQNYLNQTQGEKLVVDGRPGPLYRGAVKRYQKYLTDRKWYSGEIDGVWGPKTQEAHQKRWNEVYAQQLPNPQYRNVTLNDIGSIGNVEGLQKIARLYKSQKVDNQWGQKSKTGLQMFLNQNYGGSLVAWLRSKWGYVGNEQFGPVMKAALQRANEANRRAL